MVIMLRQYLSMPLESVLGLPKNRIACCCSGPQTKKHEVCAGSHLFNCRQQGAFTIRHEAVKTLVSEAFYSAGLLTELERPVYTAPQVGVNNNRLSIKRFDICAPSVEPTGKVFCMDITITSHVTKEHFAKATETPLVNANQAGISKRTKYRDHIHTDTEVFLPLAAQTNGAMHCNYIRLYERLAMRVNGRPPLQANWAAPTFASYWMQRTSCIIWRESIRALLRIAARSTRLAGKVPVIVVSDDGEDGDVQVITPPTIA